ncbi:MAG: HesA/MoeB/ThiF family protein [Candidatus Hecatellaceae archaeon]
MVELTAKELERYDRQLKISGFGREAQEKLKSARVVVVGVGGLGCPATLYLTAAGVGKLTLIDHGAVELSNLNRQTLYWEEDLGRPKVEAASEKLRRLNPEVRVEAVYARVREENVYSLLRGADVVVDGMDTFRERLLVNKACVKLKIPFVHAAVHGLTGQLMTVIPGETPCYQCLIPEELPTVETPVLGAVSGLLGCLEALEAVKLIAGIGRPMAGRLLVFDGLTMEFREVEVKRRDNCPACGGLKL